MSLNKEDYTEPCCPLKMKTEVTRIPVDRVICKLDEYLSKQDFSSAERHLKYWLSEAENGNDSQGLLSVLNEQIGLYRKLGKENEGMAALRRALALCSGESFEETVSLATTYINAATALKAFGKPEEALPLYRKAEGLYIRLLPRNNPKTGALYNNMGLCLCSLSEYDEAAKAYEKALEVMSACEHGEAEAAITYLNLADLYAAEYGLEDENGKITACLDKAEELLDSKNLIEDANLAYYFEKCAPVFGYYGRFLSEAKYREASRKIYERY